jgi:hypothetical protein
MEEERLFDMFVAKLNYYCSLFLYLVFSLKAVVSEKDIRKSSREMKKKRFALLEFCFV